ncbi:hypothetical protein AVEN_267129-1 [Araneus ventricosus]|uniref:Uncharacterized protein n=1 Tax=Araneus ventricosus TaxID=182803 RepID=A0A4Y2GFD5_ARAVE|nr:hypothetical protein AVEN_267129-1 [Araneus ventricosus]
MYENYINSRCRVQYFSKLERWKKPQELREEGEKKHPPRVMGRLNVTKILRDVRKPVATSCLFGRKSSGHRILARRDLLLTDPKKESDIQFRSLCS